MTDIVIESYDNFPVSPKQAGLVDDEFGIEDIEFEVHFRHWERNRMYPIKDTRRMSRADFIRHKLHNILNRKRRKES